MTTVEAITDFLDQLAPAELAASWDNVGLLVGDGNASVRRVMTCLTVTGATVAEAVDEKADLIVSHHPIPFRPIKRITSDSATGRYLLELLGARTAVYSAHTAFDSTNDGINERLARGLGLTDVAPIVQRDDPDPAVGAGRYGILAAPMTLQEFAARLKEFLSVESLRAVGDATRQVHRVAVACGSAGEFLDDAWRLACDTFVTGETTFHTCLAAEAHDMAVLLAGHFASERFAMDHLAGVLQDRFPDVEVWASRTEKDPLRPF